MQDHLGMSIDAPFALPSQSYQWRCRQAHRLEIAENTRAELERDQVANDEKVASFSDAVDVQKKALTKAKRGAGNARRRCGSRMVLALRAC